MSNNDNECLTLNNFIIFIIFCIIIIILIISLFILAINIINYILFTVYCINDNATDYFTEDLTTIILGSKYKYRLLNYIKNIHNQNNKKVNNVYNLKNKYDYMSSDLYIHTTIEYYNYIVKLLLTIIFIICVGLLYNMFNIIIAYINDCLNSSNCEFILSNIYNVNTYVFYIIVIIMLFIGIHSYIYTYVFNQNIYKDLYDLYGNSDSNYKASDIIIFNTINAINNKDIKYVSDSTISDYLYNLRKLSYDNIRFRIFLNKDDVLADNADSTLKKLRNEGIINNNKFIIPTELESDDNTNILFQNIYKTNLNNLSIFDAKNVQKLEDEQELFANKILLYLIYHIVITYNKEDPYITHKLNNIFFDTFENIYFLYNEEAEKKFNIKTPPETYIERVENITEIIIEEFKKLFLKENFIGGGISIPTTATMATSSAVEKTISERPVTEIKKELKRSKYVPIDKLVLLEKFNTDIKKMYEQINISFTIKYLLPVNTKKEELSKILHFNADLILKYIYNYNYNIYNTLSTLNTQSTKALSEEHTEKILREFLNYNDIVKETSTERTTRIEKSNTAVSTKTLQEKQLENLQKLKIKINNKINAFTDVFSDYTQENKTLLFINTIIYKINFYLAAEMMQVIIFILLVLLILYKSKKYPFLEKYINLSIVYAILIINEVVSAILGII